MKTRHFLYLAFAVAALASCEKKEPAAPNENGNGGGNTPSGIQVNLPSSGPLSVYRWSEADQIRIGKGVYTLKNGAGTVSGLFEGTPAEDKFYTIAYPADITGTDTYLAYSLTGQRQSGNGSVEHLITTALLEDVTSWENITLSKEWASSKGGIFRSNGVVAFNLTLPADAGALTALTLTASGKTFPVNNSGTVEAESLELQLANVSATAPVKAYLAVSEKTVDLPAGTLRLTVEGATTYSVLVPQAVKMGAGILTDITLSDASAWEAYTPIKGEGTQAAPYILQKPENLEQMADLLVKGKTVWFELGADIDMSGIQGWDPLNIVAPYNLAVHFDGKGHTISNFKCDSGIYPSFFGALNGTVQNVVFDHAEIDGAGKAGVVAGYCGTNLGSADAPQYVNGTITGVTVKNSSVKTDSYAGGIAGQVYCPTVISDCHVLNTTLSSTGDRVGGIAGQCGVSNFRVGITVKDCTAENITADAQKNIGGLIGVSYSDTRNCTASGHLTTNLEYTKEVSVGGLIGHLEIGSAADCSASTVIEMTVNGRAQGGFVGTFKSGKIERCYATGNVTSLQRNVGGFVGLIQAQYESATLENCYATGTVTSNSYHGGFVGLVDGQPFDVLIKDCYASGDVIATNFAAGGFIGVQSSTHLQVIHCAAWNANVTAGAYANVNWSSAAFCGVTYPLTTLTGCYRNPAMKLTALWVPAADYSHPDVSPTAPLIKQDGTPTKATSTANDQDGYPQFPYHGHVDPGKTLSQLASSTLGWSSSVWDFSGALPVLK